MSDACSKFSPFCKFISFEIGYRIYLPSNIISNNTKIMNNAFRPFGESHKKYSIKTVKRKYSNPSPTKKIQPFMSSFA